MKNAKYQLINGVFSLNNFCGLSDEPVPGDYLDFFTVCGDNCPVCRRIEA
jgi:hypothetical protein